jgi:quinoprotein glucose dehydrogenase
LKNIRNYRVGPLFNPPIQVGHPSGLRSFVSCPSGASNIYGPTVADPETGILYVTTERACRAENIVPGSQMDEPNDPKTTGRTLSQWVVANRGDLNGPQGLPIWKPPYSKIVAVDMNTGEYVWSMPNGDSPDRIRNHPALKGLNLPNTGQENHAVMMTTRTLLIGAPGPGAALMYEPESSDLSSRCACHRDNPETSIKASARRQRTIQRILFVRR